MAQRSYVTPKKTRGVAIRKKDALECKKFLARWRTELKRGDARWDELRAIAELKSKNMYDFLLCEGRWKNDWRPLGLLSRMVGEIDAYRKEALGRLEKEYYDEVEEFLKGLGGKIRKKEAGELFHV